MKYVHVLITGFDDDNEKMEVIDDESGSTKTCQSRKSKYPLDVYYATGISTNETMMICGGNSLRTSACYKYEDDQQGWTLLANMRT